MKYIIREIKDALTREQAIEKARSILKKLKEKLEKEIDNKLPVGVIYGFKNKKEEVYFDEPIVVNTDKELAFERDKLLKEHPDSTIYTLFKEHLTNDKAIRVHDVILYYENLDLVLAGAYHPDSYDKSVGGMGGWSPGYYDDVEVTKDYEYEADDDEVADALWEIIMADEDSEDALEHELQHKPENEAMDYIEEHLEELAEKYESELLKYFEDDAIEKATEYYQDEYDNYEPDYDDYEPDYEPDYDDYEPEPEPEPDEEPDPDDEW